MDRIAIRHEVEEPDRSAGDRLLTPTDRAEGLVVVECLDVQLRNRLVVVRPVRPDVSQLLPSCDVTCSGSQFTVHLLQQFAHGCRRVRTKDHGGCADEHCRSRQGGSPGSVHLRESHGERITADERCGVQAPAQGDNIGPVHAGSTSQLIDRLGHVRRDDDVCSSVGQEELSGRIEGDRSDVVDGFESLHPMVVEVRVARFFEFGVRPEPSRRDRLVPDECGVHLGDAASHQSEAVSIEEQVMGGELPRPAVGPAMDHRHRLESVVACAAFVAPRPRFGADPVIRSIVLDHGRRTDTPDLPMQHR